MKPDYLTQTHNNFIATTTQNKLLTQDMTARTANLVNNTKDFYTSLFSIFINDKPTTTGK